MKKHIKVIGTVGVLLLAKNNKIINKISPLIQALQQSGYFLSTDLINEILKRAKEKPKK